MKKTLDLSSCIFNILRLSSRLEMIFDHLTTRIDLLHDENLVYDELLLEITVLSFALSTCSYARYCMQGKRGRGVENEGKTAELWEAKHSQTLRFLESRQSITSMQMDGSFSQILMECLVLNMACGRIGTKVEKDL